MNINILVTIHFPFKSAIPFFSTGLFKLIPNSKINFKYPYIGQSNAKIAFEDFQIKAMEIAVTQGIKISVTTKFEEELSSPCKCLYYFSYEIDIENNSEHEVQLIRRKWMIFDSIGDHLLVEGEGVVGKKPIIGQNGSYKYESACKLNSSVGKMWGIYYMKRLSDGAEICIKIPEFELVTPFQLN